MHVTLCNKMRLSYLAVRVQALLRQGALQTKTRPPAQALKRHQIVAAGAGAGVGVAAGAGADAAPGL